MLFCSLPFLWFFGLVFMVYWALPWQRARVFLLLIASFYFYANWNPSLAVLIGASTALDYCLARGMEATERPAWRRLLCSISITGNLGLLAYFKYANFFLQSLTAALHAAGFSASLPLLQVILPVGISFYTFEAINYTVDVYRRRIPAERNLAHFMLFITFFPHLVAGPIVRAKDFLPQIKRPRHWDWARLNLGAQYFLMGLFKKLAVADRMAEYADPIFADPSQYRTEAVVMAVLAYAIQIYCDFSGYTDMALGSAYLLGYKLAQNFNMPYLSANIAEFWRRWHISLSTWLRDYLFIPLGGSRGGAWKTCRNLLITMTLGGLWHGASWTFVAWGVLHGLLLIVHRLFQDFCKMRPRLDSLLQSTAGTAVRRLVTFACVAVCWVFFRATTFTAALTIVQRMVTRSTGLGMPLPRLSLVSALVLLGVCHVLTHTGAWSILSRRLPAAVQGFGYAAVLVLALVLAPDSSRAFIYFQF
jgi:alginate O-acetyltransferase complex protein AlgI